MLVPVQTTRPTARLVPASDHCLDTVLEAPASPRTSSANGKLCACRGRCGVALLTTIPRSYVRSASANMKRQCILPDSRILLIPRLRDRRFRRASGRLFHLERTIARHGAPNQFDEAAMGATPSVEPQDSSMTRYLSQRMLADPSNPFKNCWPDGQVDNVRSAFPRPRGFFRPAYE